MLSHTSGISNASAPIAIRAVRPDDIPTLGRICFEAFGALQDRHGVPRDFDSAETATMVVGMFASRPDFSGFAAVETDGTLLGSNFLAFSDAGALNKQGQGAAAVGPITVRPDAQARGVGRLLMLAVMEDAKRRGIARVRLQQESINTSSLSLYTKLGFDWRECTTLMALAPAPAEDPRIRPATEKDLGSIDELSRRHYKHTRVNEVAGFITAQFPGSILRRDGRDVGYYFPGFLGHGFAETARDLADLVCQSVRHAPPMFHKAILPLGQHELHRLLMERGCRSLKMFNYMTYGPWEQPEGAWIPGIGM